MNICEAIGYRPRADAGVPGLPDDDWTAWNADEMRAAVEHLQRKRGA